MAAMDRATHKNRSSHSSNFPMIMVVCLGALISACGVQSSPQVAFLKQTEPRQATSSAAGPELPLSTKDRYIIDAAHRRFKLAAVNWYGASDAFYVPGGLDRASLTTIATLIKQMGFNSVRLPFSNAMLHAPSVDPLLLAANPQLVGKTPLEVYDAVVGELTRIGLVVILNNHTTHAMWCCNYDTDGLWYTGDYSESRWLDDWRQMVRRYKTNPLVAGADLRNEIRITKWQNTLLPQWPNWGKGPNDWRAAAERAAAQIQEINPDLLIVVEGINAPRYHLRGVLAQPVRLTVPDKLVYSVHNYGFTKPGLITGAPYGELDWKDFSRLMDKEWGYVLTPHQAYTAPVWVSEFGLGPNDEVHKNWFHNIIRYLREKDVDWAVWAINSGTKASGEKETFGYLNDDWSAATQDFRLEALQSIMASAKGPGSEEGWETQPENHLEVQVFSDWDTDRRHSRSDWAPHAYKASCREGARMVGLSHGSHGTRHYSHAALCSDYDLKITDGDNTTLFDLGADSPASGSHSSGRDWAPGATKLECPQGAVVTGVAQFKGGAGHRFAALYCATSQKSSTSSCNPIPLGDADQRLSTSGGEWDAHHRKTQCQDSGFIAGIAVQHGKPTTLLCCLPSN